MMMNRHSTLATLALVLAGSACGSSPPVAPNHRGTSEVVDLAALAPTMKPIVWIKGAPYLYLEFVEQYSDTPTPVPADLPACWADLGEDRCPASVAVPDELLARLPARPATLTVVAPTGPCEATVGPVQLLDTHGCESSSTYAAALTGCGNQLASVGFAGATVPALTWVPVPPVKPQPLPSDPSTIADPMLRERVTAWLATPEMQEGQRRQATTTVVDLDAGEEHLTSMQLDTLQGDSAEECDWSILGERVAGIRRGDQFTPIDAWQFDGILAHGGHVVAIVAGQPTTVRVEALDAAGKLTSLLQADVWRDNEECTTGSWSGVEYPCGP